MDFCCDCKHRTGWFVLRCAAHAKFDLVSGRVIKHGLPTCSERRDAMQKATCHDYQREDRCVYY